jgi:gluconolactonase
MKRINSLFFMLPLAALTVMACSKDSGSDENGNTVGGENGGENGGQNGGPNGDTPKPSEEDLKKNPIDGVAPPKAVFESGQFTDGPVWHAKLGVLFFSTPLGETSGLYRMLPDGRAMKVRDGIRAEGTTPVGNSINGAGEIVTVEIKRVTKFGFDEKNLPLPPTVIATGYDGSAAPPPPPAPADPANPAPAEPTPAPTTPGQFDTLNDVVARKDGTMFVTDPGYFAEPTANRIYRISPDGAVQVVEAFEDVPRPNGVALSPDEKFLYVGFSKPIKGTLPFIRQYIVNDDGTLGEWTKFVDVGPEDANPDGIAVDMAGNVYVASTAGIEVFRPDSSKIGVVPLEEKPTGMSFGGKDMKSLFITTEGVKIWELRVNVPGISQ